MTELSLGSFVLTGLAAGGFALAFGVALSARLKSGLATLLACAATACAAAGLAWHCALRHDATPLRDNFDALLWLAILVALVSLYLRWRRTVGRIEWVAWPITVVLLALAMIFGATQPHEYTRTTWSYTHLISYVGCSIAFAVAASSGAMYLVLRQRLRSKHAPVDARLGSLEKLERATQTAVAIGFALLTAGIVTGLVRVLQKETSLGAQWFWTPKVIFSVIAYVLYALVLHSPINPAFRGRRAAVLSIAGFVLLLGVIIVQEMR
ncbi:MAG TPA: cytochrome c biogenesis protein CcsA [Tepidisphaeraceae bacterium]